MYEEIVESSRFCATGYNGACDGCIFYGKSNYKDGDCYQQLHKAAANAIEELEKSIPRWIPVAERLPNEYGEYLVLWKPRKEGILPRNKLFYEIVEYEMDYNGIDGEWIGEIPQSAPMGGYEVCYWMDLPPEPRKEKT